MATGAVGLAVILNAAFVAYMVWGIARLGLTAHRLGLLLRVPGVLGQLVAITVRSAAGAGATGWERTPRS